MSGYFFLLLFMLVGWPYSKITVVVPWSLTLQQTTVLVPCYLTLQQPLCWWNVKDCCVGNFLLLSILRVKWLSPECNHSIHLSVSRLNKLHFFTYESGFMSMRFVAFLVTVMKFFRAIRWIKWLSGQTNTLRTRTEMVFETLVFYLSTIWPGW
jgi:hypothetical protein